MRYLSVCSGIEAATVAWRPLGWTPVAFSEIDAFPSAVLAHHYPSVPNWGDLTRFHDWPDATIDLLVGGTPCQSFSVAGLRAGLADPRGNLAVTYLAVADRYRPRWVVWENVPGVLSSNGGRDFGAFLGGLGHLGYGFAYRVLDAQYFGLAQRRKRVFVVGYLGDWRRAAAVLFERASLRGDPAPRREAGQGITCEPTGIAGSCSSKWSKGTGGPAGDEHYNLIAHALRADGFDAPEDGTGRGTPIVPVVHAFGARQSDVPQYGDQAGPLDTDGHSIGIAFALNSHAGAADGDVSNRSHASGGPVGLRVSAELAYSLRSERTQSVASAMVVRRLTPRECERLQGFPDHYTLIPYGTRGRPAKDGPRYKALGNSMAVPVVRWIGRRIQMVDALAHEGAA